MEISWNASQVCVDLQKASEILSDRNLKLSAKFAIEQWMGLPSDVVVARSFKNVTSTIDDELVFQEQSPAIYYAKNLMELGEYAHAAATLSSNAGNKLESMPPALSDLSAYGIYLRSYALYLAGERRKEEDYLELKR
jgi:hypothetical protein